MDQKRYLQLIFDPQSCSGEEFQILLKLASDFPYTQSLHTVIAKIAGIRNTKEKDELLTKAAIHSTDRGRLKSYITTNELFRNYIFPDFEQNLSTPAESLPESTTPTVPDTLPEIKLPPPEKEPEIVVVPQESKAGTGIANEILHNIEEYKRIIHQFEEFLESESGELPGISNQTDPFRNENIGNKEEPSKSRRTRKLAKEEQDAIISRFIESGNHMERPAKTEPDSTIPSGDLSLSSTSFSDDLVTETLANILEMQGKLEKAIDIYHKLIWKFPQKRAYFATRIEELKEKLIKG